MQENQLIQNYRLTRFIGEGGMGQVWLAEHTLLGRKVAVKGLHPQFARNAGIRARFKQEAATLSMLQHPNIVSLYDYIETEAEAYLVLEYVEGTPLDEYISRKTGPIPTPQLKQLFVQILDGFIYAHAQHVIHRDIKPSNFLVTADGKVKVLDFGIAKILTDANQKLTKTGTNIGTVLYMSPEQVRGQAVDARSDIYSLGVTLFQMATGQAPYPSDSAEFAVYEQIVNHPLPNASGIYPGVTPEIEGLIARATAKSLEVRFQSCIAFKDVLLHEGVSPPAIMQPSIPPTINMQRSVQEHLNAPATRSKGNSKALQSHPQSVPEQNLVGNGGANTATPMKSRKKGLMVPVAIVVLCLLGVGLWKVGVFGGGMSEEERKMREAAILDSLISDSIARVHAAQEDALRQAAIREDSLRADSIARSGRSSWRSSALDPQETVKEFYARIGNADWDGAYDLTVNDPFGSNGYELNQTFGCYNCCKFQYAERLRNTSAIRIDAHIHLRGTCNEENDAVVKLELKETNAGYRISRWIRGR